MDDIAWTLITPGTSLYQSTVIWFPLKLYWRLCQISLVKQKNHQNQGHGKIPCPKSKCIAHLLSITIRVKPPDLVTINPVALTFRLRFVRRIISRTESRRNSSRISSSACSGSREHTDHLCLVINPRACHRQFAPPLAGSTAESPSLTGALSTENIPGSEFLVH